MPAVHWHFDCDPAPHAKRHRRRGRDPPPLGLRQLLLYNPNVPPEIAERDSQECRRQAAYLVNTTLMADDPFWLAPDSLRWGPPVSGLALEQDMYRRCMTSRGYALVEDQPGRPSGPP